MTQVPFKDKATRAAGLKQALTIENRDLPYIPLVFRDQLALVRDSLQHEWIERVLVDGALDERDHARSLEKRTCHVHP